MFDHCSERIDSIPGRSIVEIDKGHYECQSYLAFKGEKEIDRVQDIKKYISETNAANKHMMAKRIPLIPASLTKGFMVEQFSNYMEDKFSIVTGLDYATVTPYVLDFASAGLLAIAGREGAGRHNWLKYSVDMLSTMYPVCISAGSACRSHESQPSHVLTAMGLTPDQARDSVRVSFSEFNKSCDVVEAAKIMAECIISLRSGVL